LIAVICAECGENFEIGDEFAGLTEYCPSCGAMNDIPDPEAPALEVAAGETPFEQISPAELIASPSFDSSAKHGIPAALWWTILIAGIGLFAVSCIFLFSSNWEDRHIQTLSDAANRGDVLMSDEDYAGAAKQYRIVLDTVGRRSIDSAFILRLIDHSRHGEAEAVNRLHSPAAAAPQTQPAAAAAATQPGVEFHLAISSFQRHYEAFSTFIRDRPVLFLDHKGNWRRRRFFVWQLAYDPPAESDSPEILLKYDCASRITGPHSDRADAARDDNFAEDESPGIVHCQTRFEFLSGRWVIVHQDADPATDATAAVNVRASLDDFYVLERLAFNSGRAGS
jgi:hypothetical protein